jgi:hypothetical protein
MSIGAQGIGRSDELTAAPFTPHRASAGNAVRTSVSEVVFRQRVRAVGQTNRPGQCPGRLVVQSLVARGRRRVRVACTLPGCLAPSAGRAEAAVCAILKAQHLLLMILGLTAAAPATAAKTSQTIAFGALAPRMYGEPPFAIIAVASSGLPVSFASRTASRCTLSGSTVTLIAAGTCTIRASQAGNATYAAAKYVDQSFAIAKANQTISFGALGDQPLAAAGFTVSATASSGLPVSFASLTAPVCTVSGNSATLVTVGICAIRAAQAGNNSYAAAPNVDRSFAVTAPAAIQYTYDGAGNVIRIRRGPAP